MYTKSGLADAFINHPPFIPLGIISNKFLFVMFMLALFPENTDTSFAVTVTPTIPCKSTPW